MGYASSVKILFSLIGVVVIYCLVCLGLNSFSWRGNDDALSTSSQESVSPEESEIGGKYLDLISEASSMPKGDRSLGLMYFSQLNSLLQFPVWEFPEAKQSLYIPRGEIGDVWGTPAWVAPLLGADRLSSELLDIAQSYVNSGQNRAASEIVLNNLALSSRLFSSKRYLLSLAGALILDRTLIFVSNSPGVVSDPSVLRAMISVGRAIDYSILDSEDYYSANYQLLKYEGLAPAPCFANKLIWAKSTGASRLQFSESEIRMGASIGLGYSDALCYAILSAPRPDSFPSLSGWLARGNQLHAWLSSIESHVQKQTLAEN